jgi:hypothetical protein
MEEAVFANLATNAAAFEAWSLALRIWCGVEKIELAWKSPSESRTDTERCHYQRFLYRAERFRSLFPDWFHLAQPALIADAEALGDGPFYLNVPGHRTELVQATNGETALELMREADLEKSLLRSKEFACYFALEKRDRQFPVGLFRGTVAKGNRIFTGAKSAIDLVGIGKDALWLFELKAGDYIPAGILSELLFYASVMRDAIGKGARFSFESRSKSKGMVRPEDIQRCHRIEAVILGEKFHPLIGHQSVIEYLNEAATRNWGTAQNRVSVNFRATILNRSAGADYQFAEI